MQHILSFITEERLAELLTALNRALNTWEGAPAWMFELTDALDAGQVSTETVTRPYPSNSIVSFGTRADGTLCFTSIRSSSDAQGDHNISEAAIELAQAIKLRKLDIYPAKFYEHVVGEPYDGQGVIETQELVSAKGTLIRMGYEWHGGEMWVPPLGSPTWYTGLTEPTTGPSGGKTSFKLEPYQKVLLDALSEKVGVQDASMRSAFRELSFGFKVKSPLEVGALIHSTMADDLENFEAPLPEWAASKVAPDSDGYTTLRAQLCTRDGRKCGNAVLIRTFGGNYTVLTDMGTEIDLGYKELVDQFYPPQWVMKPEAVGVRLNRESKPRAAGRALLDPLTRAKNILRSTHFAVKHNANLSKESVLEGLHATLHFLDEATKDNLCHVAGIDLAIPRSIITAAEQIADFFKRNDIANWKLGDVQNRIDA